MPVLLRPATGCGGLGFPACVLSFCLLSNVFGEWQNRSKLNDSISKVGRLAIYLLWSSTTDAGKIGLMMRWISVRKGGDPWMGRRSLRAFVFRMTLRASAMALVTSLALFPLLQEGGVLSVSLRDMGVLSLLVAAITGAMTGMLAFRAGLTILKLSQTSARFERLSRIDTLSGLLNRRAFSAALAKAVPGSSLVIMDVDRFKSINDRFGHVAGDTVIRRVSEIILDMVGGGVPAGRLGGEEFGLLLPPAGLESQIGLVDKLRRRIAAETFLFTPAGFRITISAGISETDPDRSIEMVYASADKALYLAKAGGRNRVVHDAQGLNVILDLVAADRAGLEEDDTFVPGVA